MDTLNESDVFALIDMVEEVISDLGDDLYSNTDLINCVYLNENDEISIASEGFINVQCFVNTINYFDQCNSVFKNAIKTGKQKRMFNECCKIVMGDNDDFCGRFTKELFKEAYNNIQNDEEDHLDELSESHHHFYHNTFKQIINSEYDKIMKKSNIQINKILKEYLKVKDKHKCTDRCTICQEKLSSKLTVKTPCNHLIHRKCLKQWMFNKKSCPICRKDLHDEDN
jgi:hypothetical protein